MKKLIIGLLAFCALWFVGMSVNASEVCPCCHGCYQSEASGLNGNIIDAVKAPKCTCDKSCPKCDKCGKCTCKCKECKCEKCTCDKCDCPCCKDKQCTCSQNCKCGCQEGKKCKCKSEKPVCKCSKKCKCKKTK